MAKIVVDTPTREGLGFQDYAEALVNIILDSGSPFTIGILGDWGVGKTSLMQTMFAKLREQSDQGVIPVWFNAWRCEREHYFAIVPLLELLVSEIKDKKLRDNFIGLLKSIQFKFCLPFGEVSAGGGSQNQIEEALYFDKVTAIETTLKGNNKKIVVFIDDLDRCAPDKILEVLESTKVFLDIKGFVYVLGMNSEVVNKAIDQKYKDLGITGEDYLEKIIQIPFKVPDWIELDLGEYLDYLIENEIDLDYKDTFKEYKDIVLKVIEKTPRQVKRFINTYISEHEVFKGKKLDMTIHLILTILKFKWYDFYHDLFYERYRNYLEELLKDETKLREEFKDKKDLVDFITHVKVRETIDTILGMNDGKLLEYRRAGMSIPQKIIELPITKDDLLELLRNGNVTEFNAKREGLEKVDLSGTDLSGVNLGRVDLSGADLSGADLRSTYFRRAYLIGSSFNMADLSDANFKRADLRMAHLIRANLSGADFKVANLIKADLSDAYLNKTNLSGANLSGANLKKAHLSRANLSDADLSEANLEMANLIEAHLSGANLIEADLSNGIILLKRSKYQGTKVKGADFTNAILNDAAFVEYLRKNGAQNVPDAITNKDEIIDLLEERGYDSEVIAHVKAFLEP